MVTTGVYEQHSKVLLTGFTQLKRQFLFEIRAGPNNNDLRSMATESYSNKTHQPTNSLNLSGRLFRMNEILDGLISGADCAFSSQSQHELRGYI